MLQPIGFWSYSHQDDDWSRRELTALREHVRSELNLALGEDVRIWQDVAIPYGSKWETTIINALDEASFFIPIITPRFFRSEFCVKELSIFRERENKLGRENLIFPIQFADISDLRDDELPFRDAAESILFIRSRKIFDFSQHRGATETHKQSILREFCLVIRKSLRENLFPENTGFSAPYGAVETKCTFKHHLISVYTSSANVSLHIDGNQIASRTPQLLPKKHIPILEATINDKFFNHKVEVFGKSGLFKASIKICVDGKKIAGDDF